MNPLATLGRHGLHGTAELYWSELCYRYARFRTRSVQAYRNPTADELAAIETDLAACGVPISELTVSPSRYQEFTRSFPFPADYHGGQQTGYWHEKIFEHFISYTLLSLGSYGQGDVFLDVAAGGSPWVKMLRESHNVEAFAIDLAIRPPVKGLDYYREEDATGTSFEPGSVRGISLHCAYEMFTGDSDIRAVREFARILTPGGAVVIVPLYLHTHYCSYSSPECWGKGHADPGAREYVRRESRCIPSSRKYDSQKLCERVLETARQAGLAYRLYALRDQHAISSEIYCHFVLELRKPRDPRQ